MALGTLLKVPSNPACERF